MTVTDAKRLVAPGIMLLSCLLLALLTGQQAAHDRRNQTELLLLAQQVSQGSALVAAEAQGLLLHNQALATMQQANDLNIAAFQFLMEGSLRRNMPPIGKFTELLAGSGRQPFDDFQATVSELIQSRSHLERILRGKDTLLQSADRLATQAESLANGLEQQSSTPHHLRAAYRTHSALRIHSQDIRRAFSDNTTAPVLPLDALHGDLKSLSTDNAAPASPTIRRTAAHLLNQLEDHLQVLPALDEHNTLQVKLQEEQTKLRQQVRTLQQQMDAATAGLYDYRPWPLYGALLFTLGCLGSAILLGYRLRQPAATPFTATSPVPATSQDHTSPLLLTQLKTEKNLLMNDIKPIGEGILYIKADEHLEVTGDLARCFNQSREALASRIEQLKRKVHTLQEALDHTSTAAGDISVPIVTSTAAAIPALIDLTFKGHAELDGLQRHLRNHAEPGKDDYPSLLARCLRAEQALDEIRVRAKAMMATQDGCNSASCDTPDGATPALATLSSLVKKLVHHLDEFQTQPVKSRPQRSD